MHTELKAPTIAALLSDQASQRGEKIAYTFLKDDEVRAITYAELDVSARAIAARVQRSARPGDRALILATDNEAFIRGFLACQHAGVIAVPVCPPVPIGSARRVATLRSIARDSGAGVVLTQGTTDLRSALRDVAPELLSPQWIHVDEVSTAEAADFRAVQRRSDDLAFLQYTSGSTSAPKGVMVPHEALMHNEELFARSMGMTSDDVIVSWLPLFHDMGLIGKVLQNLYVGAHAVLLPSLAFVQRPTRWLRAITEYRGTLSGAPNFAYDLCVHRIREEERAGLDLSSWRVAFSGAEPIRAGTLEAFAQTYAPHGFDEKAFYPGYGLAEITLMATGSELGAGAHTLSVDAAKLREGRVVDGHDQVLVSVGRAAPHRDIAIVDPATCAEVAPGEVGEIWLAGPDVARGYWNKPVETANTFGGHIAGTGAGPFLRTGDLGVVVAGRLYVTGRLKDLLIVGGLNHYPQDVEETVESAHTWIRRGCCAVFALERDDREQTVVVAEVQRPAGDASAPDLAEIARLVRTKVAAAHGVQVDEAVLVAPGSVPKTSSGKLQRAACRVAYELGELTPARAPATREFKEVG